jgi:hypothetical protein
MTVKSELREVKHRSGGTFPYWYVMAYLDGCFLGWGMGATESVAYSRMMESLYGQEG